MKKRKVTFIEKVVAIILAVAMLVVLTPELMLTAMAEGEATPANYTVRLCDGADSQKVIAGATISWEIYDAAEDGNVIGSAQDVPVGEDGVFDFGAINTALGEDEAAVVYFKITEVTVFGYQTYADTEIITVGQANASESYEIKLFEKEKKSLTGTVKDADGFVLENAVISVSPGEFTGTTNANGEYTIEGLYVGEIYSVTAESNYYIEQSRENVIIDGSTPCDFTMQEKGTDGTFQFQNGRTPEMVYGTNGNKYSNLILDESGTLGDITYGIVEERSTDGISVASGTVATIEGGELTILSAGAVVVEAYNQEYRTRYTLTIQRAEQSITFGEGDITLPYGTKNYQQAAMEAEDTDDPIVYQIEGENLLNAKIDSEGTITFAPERTGSIRIKASKAGNACYNACEAFYTLTVEPIDQKIKFLTKTVTEEYGIKEYTQTAVEVENPNDIDRKGYNSQKIVYSIEGENPLEAKIEPKTGKLTFTEGKIGSITIKAVKGEGGGYNACETTYTLTIGKAVQEISFEEKAVVLTYGTKEYMQSAKEKENSDSIDGKGHSDLDIIYSIEGDNTLGASIDATGRVTLGQGKKGTLTIKASKAGDDCYLDCDATYTITVAAADQKIAFAQKEVILIYGEKNFQQKAKELGNSDSIDGMGYSDKDIVYSLEGENPSNVTIDTESGELSFKPETIGRITVRATKPSDDEGLYKECSDTYTIEIRKSDQFIKFDEESVNLTYGIQNTYFALASAIENADYVDGKGYSSKEIEYSIVDGKNSLGAKINAETGKITFASGIANGMVTIRAEKKGDDYYNDSAAVNFTIYVTPLSTAGIAEPAKKGTLKNGWFSSKVEIHAPAGYHISYKNSLENENWNSTFVTYNTEGIHNISVYLRKDTTGAITSLVTVSDIKIDVTKPSVKVVYGAEKATKGNYYKTDRTATITINETNFDASGVTVDIVTEDITGAAVSNKAKLSSWTHTGNNHTATITLSDNAVYTFDISCEDIAGNEAADYKPDKFVIDKTAPKTSDMNISYSKELKSWEKLINKVTFGYYAYKKGVTVTLKAKDSVSGIDKMTWTYEQEAGTSTDKNVKKKTGTISSSSITHSGATATATFKLTAKEAEQFRGYISFTATDRAGNTSKAKNDNKRVNIVDTIAPKRTVTYTPAKQVVDAKTMKTKSSYKYSSEGTNSILYYDGPVTATFEITEANFYSDDVVIQVNGKRKKPKNWKQSGDKWTGSIKISGDGDYVVTMTYKDRSGKQMKKYTSEKIVIDTKDPVIKVSYENNDSKSSGGNTKYYDGVQTATITIQEHNFRAKDVKAKVTAKDVSGNDIAVMNYASYLSNKNNWTQKGDKYTAQVTYSTDANYTFDISYQDLATREAADYKQDSFTVDRTAPENLTVSYSTSIFEKVLNAVTFGYYNTQVTVTVTAEDATSGIEHFTYSYRKDSGVISVNAELIDAAIQKADVTQNGNTFTASFKIPEQVLGNGNQFNGTVDFTAYDYAANDSKRADDKRIVVDNIKPVADVTFSDPVREANNISYYAGDITATVVIHEANFYAEDVVVAVSRDGAPVAVTPSWTDEGTDIHTGTFTLHEDGDYMVTIDYTDTSSNEMDQYVSNQLTIDTQAPTVSVSNVKMNSANKDETYSFTITANDTNFDSGSFHPILTALIQNAQGYYTTETIELGAVRMSEAGKTYSYSVGNLDADAVYKLVCTVSDMAGNEYSKILLSEDSTEYDTVRFSINRNGSTYAIDEKVETLVDQYYVYSVNDDIIIEEINVDPVENYAVKMNGENLTEGSDYTTTLSANEDEWSKRTYTVKKELFDEEGEYNIVVESIDKTETTAYSDVKNLNVSFVVDQTAPVLTVSGLEESGRYRVQEQTVTVIPTDDGGKLNAFQAVVLDANGNPSSDAAGEDDSVRFEMSGEEFETYLEENNGTITFTVPEGLERQVLLVCNDMALHTDGTTNECRENFTKVTVSQSGWIIFYANKTLFYSMIVGIAIVILAAGSVIVLIIRKRKRKRA